MCETLLETDCRLNYFNVLEEVIQLDARTPIQSTGFAVALKQLDAGLVFLRSHVSGLRPRPPQLTCP